MKATDNLFVLIKSLSKSEKGYFKKYSSFHIIQNEKNNYTRLFIAIDSQKVYNESRLLKKFEGERFINQFSVAKNYLYDVILESLEAYSKTTTIELRSLLNRSEILMNKRLYLHVKKILKRAKKIAIEGEKFVYISEINSMEQCIYRFLNDKKALNEKVESLANEVSEITSQIENIAHYEKLKDQLYLQHLESGVIRSKTQIKNFDWILEEPLFQSRELALSASARILYTELRSMYYEYIGEFKKSYYYSLNVSELVEKYPFVLEVNVDESFTFLYLHSIRCSNAGLQEEAKEAIRRMEFLITKTEIQKDNRILKMLHAQLTVYIQTGKISKCLDLIPGIKQLLENGRQLDDRLIEEVSWQIISVLIISEQYKTALNWFNKITQGHVFLHQDLNYIGRIVEIILHYELGNFDIIEYRLKSVHRLQSLNDKSCPLENIFTLFFQHLIQKRKNERTGELREKIKLFLEAETIDRFKGSFFIYFIVLSWLESKNCNKKMIEIVFEKKDIRFDFNQALKFIESPIISNL